jgi:hypothetical protein
VVLNSADTALKGQANDEAHGVDAVAALVQFGDLRDDLIEGRVHETVKLNLAHRAIPANRETNRGADNGRLGQGRVDDAVLAEVLLQAVGDAKDAAQLAHVLTHDENLLVLLHRSSQSLVEGLGHGHRGDGHQCAPPLTPSSIISRRPSSMSGCGAA